MIKHAMFALVALTASFAALSQVDAGAVGGPKGDVDSVDARSTVHYNIRFRAGELAVVEVLGDGDTDLDLFIYDENGNLITSDEDYTDHCLVNFRPRWTGTFRVEIRNLGSVYNRYEMATN